MRHQLRERQRAELALGELAVMLERVVGKPGARLPDARPARRRIRPRACGNRARRASKSRASASMRDLLGAAHMRERDHAACRRSRARRATSRDRRRRVSVMRQDQESARPGDDVARSCSTGRLQAEQSSTRSSGQTSRAAASAKAETCGRIDHLLRRRRGARASRRCRSASGRRWRARRRGGRAWRGCARRAPSSGEGQAMRSLSIRARRRAMARWRSPPISTSAVSISVRAAGERPARPSSPMPTTESHGLMARRRGSARSAPPPPWRCRRAGRAA